MAFVARINTAGSIGRATVKKPTRTAIAADAFVPKPIVSLSDVNGVSTEGVENGYTLVFNSTTDRFEAQPASNVAVKNITGGTF